MERKGMERKGMERRGEERRGKERKEDKRNNSTLSIFLRSWHVPLLAICLHHFFAH
jgi:hypothetical protein